MNRSEHLAWCKERALVYAECGDVSNAISSLASDLEKHPETLASVDIVRELMFPLSLIGEFDNPGKLREFIEGFN